MSIKPRLLSQKLASQAHASWRPRYCFVFDPSGPGWRWQRFMNKRFQGLLQITFNAGGGALVSMALGACVLLGACGGGSGGAAVAASAVTTPAPSNASTADALKVSEVANGLASPCSLAFLPDSRMLVTERGGRLRLIAADGSSSSFIGGVPAVAAVGQGGLLDVVLDPAFASNRRIYLSFSEADSANALRNGTAVARAELDAAALTLRNLTVIYRQSPKVASNAHFGSRLVFDRNGFLFVTLGDRLLDAQRGFAQDLSRGNGKVVRITVEGAAAPGNPFATTPGAQPPIWSYGHRNPQGAALHPDTGELWLDEHGPQGGDEVNRVLPGRNYGWPVIS
jgi:aldose sugar dehydrogenase